MERSALPRGVLILDDSPVFVAAAADFIERVTGCAPVRADVVLIDLGAGGLELARRVKQSNAARVVIGLALFPTPELLARAKRMGIDAVVSKEAFAEELPGVLKHLDVAR